LNKQKVLCAAARGTLR